MIDQEKVKVRIREFKVKGGQLVAKVREIIEEGNARRIIIKKYFRPAPTLFRTRLSMIRRLQIVTVGGYLLPYETGPSTV